MSILWAVGILIVYFILYLINNQISLKNMDNLNVMMLTYWFNNFIIILSRVAILYLFIKILIVLCIFGIFILPLYPRYEKNIKIDDTLKNFYTETKGKIWKSLLFFIVFGLVNLILVYCFLPGQLLFRAIFSSLVSFLSVNAFYPVFICFLIIYLAVILIINVPVAVYLNSFYQLVSSLLCLNYAILMPVKDEQGKVIDTITYFENLEIKKEQVEDRDEINNSQD